ncbi:MAG: hypothetical protein WD316_02555 [Phycisphaeraceae bacterium]
MTPSAASNATSDANDTPAPRRPRRRRWQLLALALLVVLVLIGVALVPTLLSTQMGKRTILGVVNDRIRGSVDAEAVALTWFRGQSVTDLRLFDPAGEQVLHAPRIDAPDLRLLPVAMGSQRIGRVDIHVADVRLTQRPDEPTNLAQAVEPTAPTDPDDPGAELDADANVQLRVTAERIRYEAPNVEPVELTDLTAAFDVERLERIALSIASDVRIGDRPGRIDADFTLHDAFDADGQPQLGTARVDGGAQLVTLPLAMLDGLLQLDGRLVALLGEELDAELTAAGQLEDLTANVSATSDRFRANFAITSEADGLRSQPGSTLTLNVTPESFAALTAPASVTTPATPAPADDGEEQAAPPDAPATLRQPFAIRAELRELFIPRAGNDLDLAAASLDLALDSDDIELDVPDRDLLALRGLQASLQSDAIGQRVRGQLRADAQVDDVTEPVQGSLSIDNAMADAPMALAAEADALPVVLADALAQQEGRLVALIGQTLTARLTARQDDAGVLNFTAELDAPHIAGPLAGAFDPDAGLLTTNTPSPIDLTLTPDGYAALTEGDEPARLTLTADSRWRLNLAQLVVGLRDTAAQEDAPAGALAFIDPERFQLRASAAVDELNVHNAMTDGQYTMQQVGVEITVADLRDIMRIDLEALVDELIAPARDEAQPQPGQGDADPAGSIRSTTQIANLFSDTGQWQPREASIQNESAVENLPSSLLDALLDQGGTLRAVLGPRTSATASLDYRGAAGGPVDLNVRADNADATLLAEIDDEATVRLREAATARLRVTPELSAAVLTRLNPFINAAAGEEPIVVTIAADDFALPLAPFALETVRAAGSLDPGTLELRQTGLTQRFFGALSAIGFSAGDRYNAAFSPMNFSMTNGRLSYRDFVMTIDQLSLRFQGDVDLTNERYNLRLGIPGSALARLHRPLADVMRPDEHLEVPLAGTFDEPRLDTAGLSRQVAQLAARAAAEEALPDEARDILDRVFRRDRPQQDDDDEDEQEDERPRERRDPLRDILDQF